MEVVITPDSVTLTHTLPKETNNVTKLNARPVYQQSARSNATNSEFDATQVINNQVNKLFPFIAHIHTPIRIVIGNIIYIR